MPLFGGGFDDVVGVGDDLGAGGVVGVESPAESLSVASKTNDLPHDDSLCGRPDPHNPTTQRLKFQGDPPFNR